MSYDDKVGVSKVDVVDKDIQKIRAIERMTQSEPWKDLMEWWDTRKEEILSVGMNGLKTKADKELSAERWAILKGFLYAVNTANDLIATANKLSEIDKEVKEALDGTE